jgi:hypothetical protein
MAVSMLSKLDAVNKMLESIWESPVSSLDIPGLAAVAMAKRILDETSIAVQSKGWAFNTETDFVLNRDSNNNFPVPTNCIRVDTFGKDQDRDVVKRGKLLYDRDNHTFLFPLEATLNTKIVIGLDFEDMPECAKFYVATLASRIFKDKWNDVQSPSAATPEEQIALNNLEEEEAEVEDANVFSGSYSVANILVR